MQEQSIDEQEHVVIKGNVIDSVSSLINFEKTG